MSRKKASERNGENAGPIVTQEKPTAPRPRDAQGYELDQWGLPFSGPARLRALAGRPDPNVAPAGYAALIGDVTHVDIAKLGDIAAEVHATVIAPLVESAVIETETENG